MIWNFFRQFIINTMIGAVFFSTVVPLCVCVCKGCYCENSLAPVVMKTKGNSPIPTAKTTGCCVKESREHNCQCCVLSQRFVAILPITVSQVKKLHDCPSWDIVVSVPPFDQTVTFCSMSFRNERLLLFRPHVPLHVRLCVFLNL